MSKFRIYFLLSLIGLTVILLLIVLLPDNLDNQAYGIEMVSMIISIPVIFIYAWASQKPETTRILLNSFQKITKNISFLIIIIFGIILTALVFAISINTKNFSIFTSMTASETVVDVSAIQTEAVRTALANLGPENKKTVTPTKERGVGTRIPLTTPDATNTDTPEPDPNNNRPTEQSTPNLEQNTPNPNSTKEPTPTTIPDPITLTGTGDSDVEFSKWKGPAVISATHDGDGKFVIENFSKNNQKIGTIIDTTGYYVGSLPLDFLSSEQSGSFKVTASGIWEIQIIPLDLARSEIVPALIEGDGDDVVIFFEEHPDQMVVDASMTSGNFIIWAYGKKGERNLLVKEKAPYSGTLVAPPDTNSIVISTYGPWSIDISIK